MSDKYNDKIMSGNDSDLGISDSRGCHYVYVKKSRTKNKYDFHTVTSIENFVADGKHTIPLIINKKGKRVYLDAHKLKAMRNGNLYPISFYQSNLSK